MNTALADARQYFDDLWATAAEKWLSGDVTPATMADGLPVPVDYCLSTVARLIKQPTPPSALVEQVQQALRDVSPTQFFYPATSIHITLLGCTPRHPTPNAISFEEREAIHAVCKDVLAQRGPVRLTLNGVGVLGNQVFIQVLPHDRTWAELRQSLDDALLKIGASPLSYRNKTPIHMNVMRVTDASPQSVSDLFTIIERLHESEFGQLTVTAIDLLITDFVLSAPNTQFLDQISLI